MSVIRACAPCRVAKAKCNLQRPRCSRCARRGLVCTGWTPDEGGFFFLNENDIARKGSQRARRQRIRRSPMRWEIRSRSTSTVDKSDVDDEARQDFPWMNQFVVPELSQPLKRSVEERAVERFFVDWTLSPCNHGASPGAMYMLPFIYEKAANGSVLRLALRALAFADHKDYRTPEGLLGFKAQSCYGNALNGLREIAERPDIWGQDEVLSAILLIDDFEIMHLNRNEPLGPHREAIRYALQVRGNGQFFDPQGYSLWRAAHHRLLVHQLLFAEEPEPMQFVWVSRLNMALPEAHATSDMLKITSLNAAATKLVKGVSQTGQNDLQLMSSIQDLIREICELLDTISHWPDTLSKLYKGTAIDTGKMRRPADFDAQDMPITRSMCTEVINFHDIIIQYMWTVHSAAQLVIREQLVSLMKFVAAQEQHAQKGEYQNDIERQYDEIQNLSLHIINSLPPLLGYTPVDEVGESGPHAGKMLGRFMSFLPLWVIGNSRLVSAAHQDIACGITSWMKLHYALE